MPLVALDLLTQRAVLHAQLAMLAGALEDREQLVVAERLLDVIEGALVHRLHRRLQRRLRGHEDHRRVRILLPRGGEDLHAAHVRHAHVGEHDVRLERRELRETRPAPVRRVRVEAGVAQEDAERLEDPLLVVDDEHGGCAIGAHVRTATVEEVGVAAGRRDGSARGSTTVKRVPGRPAVDEHQAAVRLDGAVHDGEPETAAARLGREEGIEQTVADLERECPDPCR